MLGCINVDRYYLCGHTAGEHQMVECSTTLNCSTNGTLMSARECCVDSADGLAYSMPGQDGCHICIGMFFCTKGSLKEMDVHVYLYNTCSVWLVPRLLHWSGTGSGLHATSWVPEGC